MFMKLQISSTGLLIAAGTLACIATLLGFAGTLWWVFELATHFRVQYGIALGAATLLLLLLRQWRWATVFGLCALVNLVVIAPAFWSDHSSLPSSSAPQPTLRVLLANVNLDNRDPVRIRQVISDYHPDFVMLLETTPWLLKQLTDLAERYPHHIAAPREDPFGIALFSRHPFLKADTVYLGSPGLPSITAEFMTSGRHFTLLGTHPLPPVSAECVQDRNDQFAQLATFARQTHPPLLLLGDLNTSPWSPYFEQMLTISGLRDSARGRGIFPSWPAGWPLLWVPIDHALFSEGILIQRRETGPDIGSDHYPVIVDFQVIRS